jgi:hypothetical protein
MTRSLPPGDLRDPEYQPRIAHHIACAYLDRPYGGTGPPCNCGAVPPDPDPLYVDDYPEPPPTSAAVVVYIAAALGAVAFVGVLAAVVWMVTR